MAETRAQLDAEDWVGREWLPTQLGQKCSRERLRLTSGGLFDFDAVSLDGQIVASISTSGARTARGKLAVGKLTKIRADVLFLLLASCKRRLVILTEMTTYDLCKKELAAGRLPRSVEFFHADLPPELQSRLAASQRVASKEVSREEDK